MKERIGYVIPVVLLVGFFVWAYYRNAEKPTTETESRETEKRSRDAKKARIKDTFKELAGRHNAILDWAGVHQKVHQKENGDQRIFTIELQDAQQKLGDRTAIFVSRVADVFRTNDGFRILCHYEPYEERLIYDSDADGFALTAAEVTFLLEVDEATARHLVELHSESENEDPYAEQFFAIAARVKRATVTLRPEYRAVGEIVEAGTYDVDQKTEAEVEEGLRPRVLMTGSCLEIVHLEGYDLMY